MTWSPDLLIALAHDRIRELHGSGRHPRRVGR